MSELRQRLGIIGVLRPEDMLTTEGVLQVLGIGERKLADARATGLLKGYPKGRRMYYEGKDLIAFIKSEELIAQDSDMEDES